MLAPHAESKDPAPADAAHDTPSVVHDMPSAAPAAHKVIRFDGARSQTLFSDQIIKFAWDGVGKQLRFQILDPRAFTSAGFDVAMTLTRHAMPPAAVCHENKAYTAMRNYYVSSGTNARCAAFDMNDKTAPTTATVQLWPSTGVASGAPYYAASLAMSSSGHFGSFTITS